MGDNREKTAQRLIVVLPVDFLQSYYIMMWAETADGLGTVPPELLTTEKNLSRKKREEGDLVISSVSDLC
jgi:hypothetical protein